MSTGLDFEVGRKRPPTTQDETSCVRPFGRHLCTILWEVSCLRWWRTEVTRLAEQSEASPSKASGVICFAEQSEAGPTEAYRGCLNLGTFINKKKKAAIKREILNYRPQHQFKLGLIKPEEFC